MNKNAIIGMTSLLVILAVGMFFLRNTSTENTLALDYTNAWYEVDGEMVELGTNGVDYFGNEVFGDFNNDGREDVIFVITKEIENQEVAYYAAAAFNLEEGYEGMNAIFLGNDILPQSTNYGDNIAIINYGENSQSASVGTIGASKFILISNTGLEQVGEQRLEASETTEETQAANETNESSTEE